MLNDIAKFREFVANATDEQILKVIAYINTMGFLEGDRGIDYSDRLLSEHAIEYAQSNHYLVRSFLISELGIDL